MTNKEITHKIKNEFPDIISIFKSNDDCRALYKVFNEFDFVSLVDCLIELYKETPFAYFELSLNELIEQYRADGMNNTQVQSEYPFLLDEAMGFLSSKYIKILNKYLFSYHNYLTSFRTLRNNQEYLVLSTKKIKT